MNNYFDSANVKMMSIILAGKKEKINQMVNIVRRILTRMIYMTKRYRQI